MRRHFDTYKERVARIVNCHEASTILGVLANSSCSHCDQALKYVLTMQLDSIAVNGYPFKKKLHW